MRTICIVVELLFCFCAYGQCKIREIRYGIHDHYVSVFEITNNSSENYYFWIARTPVSNYREKDLIHDYFFSRNSSDPTAVSLSTLIYDWDFPSLQTNVGFSFIKEIRPNHSFYVVGEKLIGDLNAFKDSFVTISVEKVEKLIGRIPYYLKYPLCTIYIFHEGTTECGNHKDSYSFKSSFGSKDTNMSWGLRLR